MNAIASITSPAPILACSGPDLGPLFLVLLLVALPLLVLPFVNAVLAFVKSTSLRDLLLHLGIAGGCVIGAISLLSMPSEIAPFVLLAIPVTAVIQLISLVTNKPLSKIIDLF